MSRTDHKPHRPFSNGIKPVHVLFLCLVLLFKVTYGGVDLRARRSASEDELSKLNLAGSTFSGHDHHHGDPLRSGEEEHGHGEEGHGYQVFHVEFSRVEVPFIIALWIFVSSLAKIGKIFFSPPFCKGEEEGLTRSSHVQLTCNATVAGLSEA